MGDPLLIADHIADVHVLHFHDIVLGAVPVKLAVRQDRRR